MGRTLGDRDVAVARISSYATCIASSATNPIPRYIRFTSEFPMTVTGKVQKFKMRGATVAELTLARVTDVEPT